MGKLEPTIPLGSDTTTRFDKSELDRVVQDLAHASRGWVVVASLGGQVGAARRFNVAVKDGRNRAILARVLLRVWIATELGAAPGGTQTATVTKGVLVQAIVAGQLLEVMTDARGEASIDVEGSAGTRACHAVVLGPIFAIDGSWT